jgi:iron complex transport system ATP-binding protein
LVRYQQAIALKLTRLELTQIGHLLPKHYEISDGQLQKSIDKSISARYTTNNIDEPTTHLDLLHKVALFKLLKLTNKLKNVFYSLHMILTYSIE